MMALKAQLNTISPYFGWLRIWSTRSNGRWSGCRGSTREWPVPMVTIAKMPLEAKFKTDPKKSREQAKWADPTLD